MKCPLINSSNSELYSDAKLVVQATEVAPFDGRQTGTTSLCVLRRAPVAISHNARVGGLARWPACARSNLPFQVRGVSPGPSRMLIVVPCVRLGWLAVRGTGVNPRRDANGACTVVSIAPNHALERDARKAARPSAQTLGCNLYRRGAISYR